ncbi:MAG: flagellin [Phycisphaeraceae bacterium JB051]
MKTLHQLDQTTQSRQISMTRLATAQKINRAAEAPAALIASEKLRSQIALLEAESKSLQRTSHVIDTADGAMSQMSDQIIEARAANVALANSAGLTDGEREALQMQVNMAVQSVDRIARQSNFAGTPTLDGNMTLTASDETLTIPKTDPTELGEVTSGSETYRLSDIDTVMASGDTALSQSVLDDAFSDILTRRAEMGAFDKYTVQSRYNSLQVELENTVRAESEIRDTDYAREVSELNRTNILEKAAYKALEVDTEMRSSMFDLIV